MAKLSPAELRDKANTLEAIELAKSGLSLLRAGSKHAAAEQFRKAAGLVDDEPVVVVEQ